MNETKNENINVKTIDNNKFKFKKDFSSTFLFIGFSIMTIFFDFCLITDFNIYLLIVAIIFTLIDIVVISFHFNSYCLFEQTELIIKSGFLPKEKIKYEKIYYITGKTNGQVDYSTYISKLQITYDISKDLPKASLKEKSNNKKANIKKRGRSTIISPADTKIFIETLKEKNPKIIDEIKIDKAR